MDKAILKNKKKFEKYKQKKKKILRKNSYIPMKFRKLIHPILHVMLFVSRNQENLLDQGK